MKKSILLISLLLLTFACSEKVSKVNKEMSKKENLKVENVEKADDAVISKSEKLRTSNNYKESKSEVCSDVKTGNRIILSNQTFPIDFEPFENSCFVTTFDPQYRELPSAIELAIYTENKKVYTFESRFNPNSVNCTVNAVSFEDLNNDQLKDVIVVGKCVTKSGDILANEVFINSGDKTFVTETANNDKLENFKTVKEIENFVKKNEKLFAK